MEESQGRGGGEGKQGRGKVKTQTIPLQLFSSLLVHSGRSPKEIKDKEGRGKKTLHVGL